MASVGRISQAAGVSASLPKIAEDAVRHALAHGSQPISDVKRTAFLEARVFLQQQIGQDGGLSGKSEVKKPLDQATLDALTEGIG